jgi:hypothetical protein
MNTKSKKTNRISITLAAMAMIASIATANAGAPMHKLATSSDQPATTYEIKVVGMPSEGHPLTVQVINKQTGQLMSGADVSMQHLVWAGAKAVPQMQLRLIALDSDGRGDFVCLREHLRPGERVVIRAHVPGELSGTWTTVALNN